MPALWAVGMLDIEDATDPVTQCLSSAHASGFRAYDSVFSVQGSEFR